MMGRGPDGGCGSGERPCRPNYRVTASKSSPATMEKKTVQSLDVDFFSQARKALCERSPFDVPEEVPGSVASSSTTLPSGLASLLRHSESRKKNKKSHHTGGKKSSARAGERSRGGNIWVETEDCFRDLALADVDALFELCSPVRSFAARSCFSLPNIGSGGKQRSESWFNQGNSDNDLNASVENLNGAVSKSEGQQEGQHDMEIDSVGVQSDGTEILPQAAHGNVPHSDFSGSLGWVLGCRNRNLLTSERPSKKRKLLGCDAGLDKVLVGAPCEGNSSVCDFCCKGDLLNDSNKLIVCFSCHIAVHSKCYGVQGDIGDPWLCTRCNQISDDKDVEKQPCVLCPKQGGASKPVGDKNGNSELDFAHLFCSIWMPEVYVEDLTKMEPIMNVSGIKESHKKLVCNVCKVKRGACVRCSHGTCRLAFHPICAREARCRIEVWGKYGHDGVELRAFCSKHSGLLDGKDSSQAAEPSLTVRSASDAVCSLAKQSPDKLHEISGNGDKLSPCIGSTGLTSTDKSEDLDQRDLGSSDSKEIVKLSSKGDILQRSDPSMSEKTDIEDPSSAGSLNLALLMKKLIHRGKINAKDVATELGMSPDSLTAILAEDKLVPEVRSKIYKWLSNNACMGASQKNLRVKLKSAMLPTPEGETGDISDVMSEQPSDITDTVAIKSVPPRRRTRNNIKFRKNGESSGLSVDILAEIGMGSEFRVEQLVNEEPKDANKASTSNRVLNDGASDCEAADSPKSKDSMGDFSGCSSFKKVESRETDVSAPALKRKEILIGSDVDALLPDLMKMDVSSSTYIHPSIRQELSNMHESIPFNNVNSEREGVEEVELSSLEASSNANACCNHESNTSECNDNVYDQDGGRSNQLLKADALGVLPLSPADELEGEIVYFQHKLLSSAVQRKQITGNLVDNLSKSLPHEIDVSRKQIWDSVLVNQYICELREAKKQGRKEKKHKEAQAILAAATAAVAASSRTSFLRKDASDEFIHNEKLNVSNGRPGLSSQSIPRPKGTLSRATLPRISSDKYSDFVHSAPEVSKEHPRSCDICRRSETILNPILVCSSCKVAVHLDCYRNVKESPGPWHCELCEELLSARQSDSHSVNFWEKPYFVAECGLCGGATGAFRKCINGQWVHAFCAEWLLQSLFRRGQVNPVEGMEDLLKQADVCCVCRRKHGACLRCSYGHCQTTFHPSCARSAGFYMNVRFLGGKFQHKAYCEQHSLEQRLKVESQKHGVDELKSIKQIRVELERLRLLCERIIKREKLKRDLVICSHSILASKRDNTAHSALVQNPFFHPDASSESATTSLRGNTADGYSDVAIQRSDEITVDSAASSVKKRLKVTMATNTEQKTDDNSLTSQNPFSRNRPTQRPQFAGKQIPKRSGLPARNLLDEVDVTSRSRKRVETLQKELVMTSDQASMRNQQLPKGYFYIPVDCLPKEKTQRTTDKEASCAGDPLPP